WSASGPTVNSGAAGAGAAGLTDGGAVCPWLTRIAITARRTGTARVTPKALPIGTARSACSSGPSGPLGPARPSGARGAAAPASRAGGNPVRRGIDRDVLAEDDIVPHLEHGTVIARDRHRGVVGQIQVALEVEIHDVRVTRIHRAIPGRAVEGL